MDKLKVRYDKFLEMEIEKAKERGDFKDVFILELKLNSWNGYDEN